MADDLPSGWQLVRLDEVAGKPQYGWTSAAKANAPGLPLLRTTDITRGPIDWSGVPRCVTSPPDASRYLLRSDDVVVSRAGSVGFGALIAAPPPAVFASYLMRLRPGPRVMPRYLRSFLRSPAYWTQISEVTNGIALQNINGSKLAAVQMPLPPLDEQRRIVEILEDHLSRLDAAENDLAIAMQHVQSLREGTVRSELTGGRAAAGRDVRLENADVDDGTLPALPSGWKWRRLYEIAEVVGGVTKDAKRQLNPTFVDVPYLRVANVQRGRLDLSTVTSIRVPQSTAEKLKLSPGDVLLNEGGDRDKLGRGWVWEGQVERCIHQNHVFRARVRDSRLDPYLLSWAANSFGGRWCERNGRQSVNLASISLSKIRMMPVPVPPREEQQAVADRIREVIDASHRLERAVVMARQRGTLMRRSLLAAAFAGRLT